MINMFEHFFCIYYKQNFFALFLHFPGRFLQNFKATGESSVNLKEL